MEAFIVSLGMDPAVAAWLRLDTFARLLLAALLGGMVGAEREISGKPAGLRTNLLICVGAALVTELSVAFAARGVGDPARLAAQIVSGIGFIGAGTIIQARGHVRGLTTAATLWVVAAIGIAVGVGAYVEAVGASALVLIALFGLRLLERAFARRWVKRRYRILLAAGERPVDRLREVVRRLDLGMQIEGIERRADGVELLVRLDGAAGRHDELLPEFAQGDLVRRAQRG